MRQIFSITLCACLVMSASARAQDMGDPRAGLQIARTICADCHVVENTQPEVPGVLAPDFVSIAQRRALTALAVRVILRTPHRTMPNLILDDREIDDLAAYLLSLRKPSL